MKVAVRSLGDAKKFKKLLLKHGFTVTNRKPDFMLLYGGDGTTLYNERLYPGLPKLVVKQTKITHDFEINENQLEDTLKRVARGKYRVVEKTKLEAEFRGKRLIALNEIQIRNKDLRRAIRFSVHADGKTFEKLIGDGVVISTPFGCTGYFSAVGGKKFSRGIGVAFNNLYGKKIKSFVVKNGTIKVTIERGTASLAADNNPKAFTMKDGDSVKIRKHGKPAKFIKVVEKFLKVIGV